MSWLEYVNGDSTKEFRQEQKEDEEIMNLFQKFTQTTKQKEVDQMGGAQKKEDQVPLLENLCEEMEAANSYPSKALDHMKKLSNEVEMLVDKMDLASVEAFLDKYYS